MKVDEKTTRIVFTKMSRRQFEYILEDNTPLTGFCRTHPDQDEWEEDHFIYYNKVGVIGKYQNGRGCMYPINLLRTSDLEPVEVGGSWRRV